MERNELGIAFAELWRMLRPSGCALVAFHVGSDTIHNTEWWGYSVNLDATFFTSGEIVEQLQRAGFEIEAAMERDPYPEVEYQSTRGYVVAVKPAEGSRDE